jgi:hypothetical protein
LKAFKADNSEAYTKLINTAKIICFTHPLRQSDSYLDLLAQAVVAQQNDDVHKDTRYTEEDLLDETVFSTQTLEEAADEKDRIDYYGIVHRMKEKVDKQLSILVGGTLEKYHLKAPQWMVSAMTILMDRCIHTNITGSQQDDLDDFTHNIPYRGEEAAWAVPRYCAAVYHDELVC